MFRPVAFSAHFSDVVTSAANRVLLMVNAIATVEDTDMKSFAQKIKRFLASEDGPTAVEYAVLLALIIAICIASVKRMGEMVDQRFVEVEAAF